MTQEQKYETVMEKNTFYFFNPPFENKNESYINSLREILLNLKNDIETSGLKKPLFERILEEKENGLKALLVLTGFSNENLKRLITLIRIVADRELSELAYKDEWCRDSNVEHVKEWSTVQIYKLIRKNPFFRKGVVNLFFAGSTIPFLVRTMPPFELKKLSISKLKFEIPEMIDTLIRYKEKGSYSAKKDNNPEIVIENILDGLGVSFTRGDLSQLIAKEHNTKRSMDFIIPNQQNPLIIIECSFLTTTSSGQGDKSKAEIGINSHIKSHYPRAKFIGFVDGIGWYVRENDLRRMVSAYDDVFTFHQQELGRFKNLLTKTFSL